MRNNFGIADLWLFQESAGALLQKFAKEILPRHRYRKITTGERFVYASGKIPVLLVAHVDTVHRMLPREIFHDSAAGVLWSPQGIGADDRAGVLGILELLRRKYRPHIMLLDGEEVGGIGSQEAVHTVRDPGILYAVELDRRNGTDAVFYDCANEQFIKYVLGFGFQEAAGSFSDISIICPAWRVAGVNLSCGQYNVHTPIEYLKLQELWDVVGRVEKMLQTLPKKRFRYIEKAKMPSPYLPGMYPPKIVGGYGYEDGFAYGDFDPMHSWTDCVFLDVAIDPEELAILYGGDVLDWEAWLCEHKDHLEDLAAKAIMDTVRDYVTPLPKVTENDS